jgi:hypothetical protein
VVRLVWLNAIRFLIRFGRITGFRRLRAGRDYRNATCARVESTVKSLICLLGSRACAILDQSWARKSDCENRAGDRKTRLGPLARL